MPAGGRARDVSVGEESGGGGGRKRCWQKELDVRFGDATARGEALLAERFYKGCKQGHNNSSTQQQSSMFYEMARIH